METQSEHTRPIPAFYCCYLLRSTVRHASLYIGSTPNPARRLAQHNGVAKGGAHRTAREKLRPWEMVVIVEGFMSRIGALQFEWAWQNAGGSRHIETDEHNTAHASGVRIDPRTGREKPRGRRRSGRSLTSHLADLHLLLRSTYFASWPLKVRFFSEDVYRVWQVWSERVDGLLSDNMEVVLEGTPSSHNTSQRVADSADASGVKNLDIGYSSMRDYLEKAQFLLDDSEKIHCGVCKEQLRLKDEMVVVCPTPSCHSTSHLVCLSSRFLQELGVPNQFVPTDGTCVACEANIKWPMLMKELSLRTRGEKEIQVIFKKRRKRLPKQDDGTTGQNIDLDANRELPQNRRPGTVNVPVDNQTWIDETENGEDMYGEDARDEIQLDDDWMEALDVGSDSETNDQSKTQSQGPQTRVEIVIEDSDWDEAEMID